MLKPHKLCSVCKHAEANPKLLKAIYDSTAFMKGSSITLTAIYEQYSASGAHFSYEALRNHVKKHQFMSEKDFNARHLRQIATQAEKTVLKRQIESAQVWDTVIQQGMEKLEAGEMPMKTADLLKAAKDKSDYEMKVKDQQLAMMEMVMFFASGEGSESKAYDRSIIEGKTVEDFDPSEGIAVDSDDGADGPGAVHYPPAWDAAASGPSALPTGDDQA